ncbi:MAG: class I SAM-dependent methyltransferase [Pseudomonadales bacterium]
MDEPRLAAFVGCCRFVREADAALEFHLVYDGQRLELRRRGDTKGLWVDRLEIERRLRGRFLLGRACGIRRNGGLSILDATAGLGIDGLALALSGQRLHLVERNPVLWALLVDLRERLGLVERVHLTLGDSLELLESCDAVYDVICFDPMFPGRSKRALPGKRMQYLAALLGDGTQPDEQIIGQARSRATSRVVLKRRLKDPQVGRPDWVIRGRAVRYDVYQGRAGSGERGSDQPSSNMA